MFGGSTDHAEREPVVDSEREVKANVGLHTDDDAYHHIGPDGQRVTVEEPGVGCYEEPDRDELPRVEVLGHPAERTVVPVVHRVYPLIQEPDAMVAPMPDEILKVENQQTGNLMPDEFEHGWCQIWQGRAWSPDPLGYGGREDIQDMVPKGES